MGTRTDAQTEKALSVLSCLTIAVLIVCFTGPAVVAQSSADSAGLAIGPGNIFVHPKFGGQILGYGIDASGTEGLLSEYKALQGGNAFIATETFDQKTGAILKVLAQENDTQDSYATWGVFSNHMGVDQFGHNGTVTFPDLNPLDANKFTGQWKPPIPSNYILGGISNNQGVANVAVIEFENGGSLQPKVFSSNIAANTFGPRIQVTNSVFNLGLSPVFAYDTKTNQAVLAGSFQQFGDTTYIDLVNLATRKITEFNSGLGSGGVLGIAVDSSRGIAVTTTYYDNGIEFYNLQQHTGFEVTIPCSAGTFGAAMDVQFDAIHSLFLVEEGVNSCDSFSRLVVYDENGNVVETLTGFQILPASPTPIALNPGNRSGFVFANRVGTALRSFTY
jgi:hypothetical protein